MKNNYIVSILIIIALCAVGFYAYNKTQSRMALDASPQNVTMSGTYTCLPHKNTDGPQTMECAFGFKADNGDYYAVNFGASANAMNQFQSQQHITADGFVVAKEALSTNQWDKYNMKGIFTITRIIEDSPQVSAKLNINVVCESALSYMTFKNGEESAKFVAECKEGKHPEVIERYKKDMNLGDGAAI